MTFLSALALSIAALVIAPYLAHRLRRRRAEEQPFPPARLVTPAPPQARRRSRLEDRALLASRAASIIVLAVLGATPFVRCSQLSLRRTVGASIAIAVVVDDSMSMRTVVGGRTRFERARRGATELLASAREGDSVSLILAGAPNRVALGATTDLSAARQAVEALVPSDRATDLEGAIALARASLGTAPQTDRRIVVLSDLADGHSDEGPLGANTDIPIWVALPGIAGSADDCALIRADQRGSRVGVEIACGPGQSVAGREIIAEDAKGTALGRAAVPSGGKANVTVFLRADDVRAERVRLSGADAIAADDTAPVLSEAARGAVGVVADFADETVATGSTPIVEQALAALELDAEVVPMPAVPDAAEDLAGRLGLILDDPPGLTPEQRHTLGGFIEGGGGVLLALGPHAAAAPLGASLEPILTQAVSWSETTERGVDPPTVLGRLAETAASLADLSAARRAVLSPADTALLQPVANWADGHPLVARRPIGRGEAWIVTLPFSVEASDLTLRPAFLALLEAWLKSAREHAAPLRSDVGATWSFPGVERVHVEGPAGAIEVTHERDVARVAAGLLGLYRVTLDGKIESRVAQVDRREVDLRPRPIASNGTGESAGRRGEFVDISSYVALALLALLTLEMSLRVFSRAMAAT